jgi:hypothetical protein
MLLVPCFLAEVFVQEGYDSTLGVENQSQLKNGFMDFAEPLPRAAERPGTRGFT